MPVYKRKIKNKLHYYAKVYYTNSLGEHLQEQSPYFKSAQEAKEAEIQITNKVKHVERKKINFNEAFQEYIVYQKEKVKQSTWNHYGPLYEHIKPLIGKIDIAKLTVQQYKKFKDDLPAKMSLSRKNRAHRFVKTLIQYTNTMYGITSTVPERVGGFVDPNAEKKEMQFYTYPEFLKFINELKGDPVYWSFYKTLYFQGLRMGEANGLQWKDIDFKKNTMHIKHTVNTKIKGKKYVLTTPKTRGSNRKLPLEKEVTEALKMLYSKYSAMQNFNDSWFVFGGIYPLSDTTMALKKNKAAKSAGLKIIRIHDFRHSCASYYIHLGAQPILISKLLGHSKLSITLDTYSHMYPTDLEKLIVDSEKFKINFSDELAMNF